MSWRRRGALICLASPRGRGRSTSPGTIGPERSPHPKPRRSRCWRSIRASGAARARGGGPGAPSTDSSGRSRGRSLFIVISPTFGPQPLELVVALVRRPTLERGLAARQELLPPVGQGPGRHSELARQAVERLAAQHTENRLRLPAGREPPRLAQPIGVRRRARKGLPTSLASPHVHLRRGASSPPTTGLQSGRGCCVTTWKIWWAGTGLNRRHQDFQSCPVLPLHAA